jgi:hypothetical protein
MQVSSGVQAVSPQRGAGASSAQAAANASTMSASVPRNGGRGTRSGEAGIKTEPENGNRERRVFPGAL